MIGSADATPSSVSVPIAGAAGGFVCASTFAASASKFAFISDALMGVPGSNVCGTLKAPNTMPGTKMPPSATNQRHCPSIRNFMAASVQSVTATRLHPTSRRPKSRAGSSCHPCRPDPSQHLLRSGLRHPWGHCPRGWSRPPLRSNHQASQQRRPDCSARSVGSLELLHPSGSASAKATTSQRGPPPATQ